MTSPRAVDEWLATRTPAPPRLLAERIGAFAASSRERRLPATSDASTAEQLLAVAEDAMRVVLHDGCLTRERAVDLLAVDAVVTYAFEASADHPERLEEIAGSALARIAALADPSDG